MSEIRSQATPARDELAEKVFDTIWRTETTDFGGYSGRDARAVADHLWAEGYRKPRTVNTAAELDALPHESVIRDSLGDVYEKWSPPDESMTEWMTPGTSWTPAPTLPATVLFTPGEAG